MLIVNPPWLNQREPSSSFGYLSCTSGLNSQIASSREWCFRPTLSMLILFEGMSLSPCTGNPQWLFSWKSHFYSAASHSTRLHEVSLHPTSTSKLISTFSGYSEKNSAKYLTNKDVFCRTQNFVSLTKTRKKSDVFFSFVSSCSWNRRAHCCPLLSLNEYASLICRDKWNFFSWQQNVAWLPDIQSFPYFQEIFRVFSSTRFPIVSNNVNDSHNWTYHFF